MYCSTVVVLVAGKAVQIIIARSFLGLLARFQIRDLLARSIRNLNLQVVEGT